MLIDLRSASILLFSHLLTLLLNLSKLLRKLNLLHFLHLLNLWILLFKHPKKLLHLLLSLKYDLLLLLYFLIGLSQLLRIISRSLLSHCTVCGILVIHLLLSGFFGRRVNSCGELLNVFVKGPELFVWCVLGWHHCFPDDLVEAFGVFLNLSDSLYYFFFENVDTSAELDLYLFNLWKLL